MNTNQLSWASLPARALFHSILPSRSLQRPKSALPKSRVASLPCCLLTALGILNCTTSWSLQPRLPLRFTLPMKELHVLQLHIDTEGDDPSSSSLHQLGKPMTKDALPLLQQVELISPQQTKALKASSMVQVAKPLSVAPVL